MRSLLRFTAKLRLAPRPLLRPVASSRVPCLRPLSSSSGAPVTEQTVIDKLSGLNAAHLQVQDTSGGCGSFFRILVVSPQFEGKSQVNRQRLVNQQLGNGILSSIHGLTMHCLTEAEWKAAQEAHRAQQQQNQQ